MRISPRSIFRSSVLVAAAAVGALVFLAGCSNPVDPPAALPVISASGEGTAWTVSTSSPTSGATIHYTTDGSTPTASSATYSSPFVLRVKVGTPTTVKAVAVAAGKSTSPVATANVGLGHPLVLSAAVTTLAGSSTYGGTNGTGTAATFDNPEGIATDGTYLYVAEYGNNDIRRIDIATGSVTTLAGTGSSGSKDGTGTSASFGYPADITTDGSSLYVADTLYSEIRKIE